MTRHKPKEIKEALRREHLGNISVMKKAVQADFCFFFFSKEASQWNLEHSQDATQNLSFDACDVPRSQCYY